jgi:hypothetical protein
MKKPKDWYKQKGMMELIKDDRVIRQYRYNDSYSRRKIQRIWNSEVKPNGVSRYELIIIPEIDADVR